MKMSLFKNKSTLPSLWDENDPFNLDMDRLNEAFSELWPRTTRAFMRTAGRPTLDVADKGDSFEICADLPGMKKNDIHVELVGTVLVIEGKREEKKEENQEGYMHQERFQGTFCRRIDLGEDVRGGEVKATYSDGVLTLKIPKETPRQSKSQKINIE
jgi:HSP20 family protein